MVVKNLTDKQQKITVKEITGERRVYDIYLAPNGSTELDRMIIAHEYDERVIEIVGQSHSVVLETPVVEEPKKEEPKVEETIIAPEETDEVQETEEDSTESTPEVFICDICGAEFASARGLATHKNKAHSE